MEQTYCCPKCKSENVIRFEVAHKSGTSTGLVSATSFSAEEGRTVTTAKTTSQTELARLTAPPQLPTPSPLSIVALALGLILIVAAVTGYAIDMGRSNVPTILLWGVVIAGGGTALSFYEKMHRDKVRPEVEKAYAKWKRSWYCQRCGITFQI